MHPIPFHIRPGKRRPAEAIKSINRSIKFVLFNKKFSQNAAKAMRPIRIEMMVSKIIPIEP